MATPPPVELVDVSRWYGQVLGVSGVSLRVESGIVGLLGPNGAGKSTLMKLMVGLLNPSKGSVLVHGVPVGAAAARARLGYCPEHDGVWEELTAREMVTVLARLSGLAPSEAARAAAAELATLGLEEAMDRRLGGYSKGMRQRAKLAQAFVHAPDLLVLDEPLTGCDPLARLKIIARIRALASAGTTVVISSHVLHEIEALTDDIVLIYRGQVLAEGNIYRIRELIDEHPHRVRIECDRPRELAARLIGEEHVERVRFEGELVELETRAPDRLYDAIPLAAEAVGATIHSLTSPDNNLQSVFEYLTHTERPST